MGPMPMTPQFKQLLNQINSPVIRQIIATKYYNNIAAAKAAIELEKLMIDAIEKQNEMIREMQKALNKVLEDNENFRDYFESQKRNGKDDESV